MSAELDEKWLELHEAGKASWVEPMRERLEGCRFAKYPAGDRTQAIWITEETRYESVRAVLDPLTAKDVPDWSDPATLGALLGQVRKRYMDPTIYARPDQDGWRLFNALGPVDPRGCRRSGFDEASALLCGLELAP